MTGRVKYIFLGLLILITAHHEAGAQYIEVRTELDTNQIRIGEPLHLDILVHQPPEIRVDFPVFTDTVVDKLEVLQSIPADTVLSDGELDVHQRYRLTSFDSGLYVIPPMKFRFHSDVWTDSLESNPLYLYVHTVAVDSSIYDVKAPVHIPVGFMELFPYIAGGILLLGSIGFLIWYLRRRKRNKPLFRAPRPEDPAHIIAFRELRDLKDEKLWQKNEFKKYYTRLTEIIRRYMQRRFGFSAMEMTSSEIMVAWKETGEGRADLEEALKLLLNLSDLVKFAKQKPIASENEENMERAYNFIELTKWVKPESEGDDG